MSEPVKLVVKSNTNPNMYCIYCATIFTEIHEYVAHLDEDGNCKGASAHD